MTEGFCGHGGLRTPGTREVDSCRVLVPCGQGVVGPLATETEPGLKRL